MAEQSRVRPRAVGTFGNAGRNILTAPGFEDIDFAIAKNTAITERVSLQFRAEAFNLFNHPNFGQPSNNFAAANYGTDHRHPHRARRSGQLAPAPIGHEADLLSRVQDVGLAGPGL